MNYKRIICGVALSCTAFFIPLKPTSLLVIDTQGKDAYYYRNIIALATSAGFKVDYKNIYDLLENSDINQYQALFFMMNPQMLTVNWSSSFFNALLCVLPRLHTSTIPEYCWHVLRTFAQQSNKAIGIILPGHIQYSPQLQKQAYKAIQRLGVLKHRGKPTQRLTRQFVMYLTTPDQSKGALFGTSLINPGKPTFPTITDRNGKEITKIINPNTKEITAILTPMESEQYNKQIQQAFPIGLLIKDPKKNNMYLISKTSEFDFADVFEHLFKNPFSIEDRNELLHAAQETLLSWQQAYSTNQIAKPTQQPTLPYFLTPAHLQKEKNRIAKQKKEAINKAIYGWVIDEGISCAWLDPYDFYAHEDGKQKLRKMVTAQTENLDDALIKNRIENLALRRGIKLIYHADFNLLWFELLPEWYLSPHGMRKEQREEYIERIKRLGNELHHFFIAHNRSLPKIFVGLNLTSNFRAYPVQNPVQDLYGTTYTKIPCPFDMNHFWKPEVLSIFDEFVSTFQDSFPIDGVFFDFEMYHAPEQGGMYSDLMDFSDLAWHTYCKNNDTSAPTLKTVKDRVTYLQKEKLFHQYFSVLEQASRTLGNNIKHYMRMKKPNLIVGAYAPTLPYSWFYRGIMAGLSSPSEPLLLATFNTDYTSHYHWLTKHHIHLLHGTAIMLSKLKQADNFHIIPSLLKYHDFMWYNRPSRMIYEYTQEELDTIWWGIEATPTNTKKIMRHIATNSLRYLS